MHIQWLVHWTCVTVLDPWMRIVRIRYLHFIQSHVRMYTTEKITAHVLWLLVLSLKVSIPSVLKPNQTFLGSLLKSFYFLSNCCDYVASAGCWLLPSSFLHSSSHQVIIAASLGFKNICLKWSMTCRFHITRAGIFLCFASYPWGVSSCGAVLWASFCPPFFLLFFFPRSWDSSPT